MENHFNCIYMYVNKINGKKYIGQAKNFKKRHRQHIHHSKNNKYNDYYFPIHNAIRKYGIDNFDIVILKENIKTQCLLNLFEYYYIKKYNTLIKNNNGYNVASGGHNGNVFEGKSKEEMDEIRKKMSMAQGWQKGENNPMYGVHRYGKNAPNYGKPCSEEKKQKISESLKGKYKEENNPKSISVIQYDKNGILIKVWCNMNKASRCLNINIGSISSCCKGKRKSAGGYIWKYAKGDEENE